MYDMSLFLRIGVCAVVLRGEISDEFPFSFRLEGVWVGSCVL